MMMLHDVCWVTCRSFQMSSDKMFVPTSETILLSSPCCEKYPCHAFIRRSTLKPFTYFFYEKFAVVIYNTKIMHKCQPIQISMASLVFCVTLFCTCWPSLWIHMLVALLSLGHCDVGVQLFGTVSCNDVGTIIPLLFMAISIYDHDLVSEWPV